LNLKATDFELQISQLFWRKLVVYLHLLDLLDCDLAVFEFVIKEVLFGDFQVSPKFDIVIGFFLDLLY
jgi:hypothetical protein